MFDKLEANSTTFVSKDNKIVIDKRKYNDVNSLNIIVKNTAVLETYFPTEAPMVDIIETHLKIIFNEEEIYIKVNDVNRRVSGEIPRPKIASIKLYRQTINNLGNKKALYTAKKTATQFICAGQVLIVEAEILNFPTNVKFYIEGDSRIQTLDDLTKRFVHDEPKARNEKLVYSTLTKLKKSYELPLNMDMEDGLYKIKYIIPYKTKQTIHSWSSLRMLTNSAFEIDENKLFTRISSPYKIKIRASNAGGTVTKSINLDVFERWDTIYNRDISEYVK